MNFLNDSGLAKLRDWVLEKIKIVQSALTTHNTTSDAHSSLFGAKQNKVSVSGIVKGDGAGNLSAATAGTDYATPTNVSDAVSTHDNSPIAHSTRFDAKQDALTFDEEPTANSENPVYSGGVYSMILSKPDMMPIFLFNDEDSGNHIQYGTATLNSSGYTNIVFEAPFDGVPAVTATVIDGSIGFIGLDNITDTGFQARCLRYGVTTTTDSFYTASGIAATSTHSANTMLTGVTLNAYYVTNVKINYIAIYNGG